MEHMGHSTPRVAQNQTLESATFGPSTVHARVGKGTRGAEGDDVNSDYTPHDRPSNKIQEPAQPVPHNPAVISKVSPNIKVFTSAASAG